MKPTIHQTTKPHWSMTLDFPNGEKVVIADASGEDSMPHGVVVTVATDPLHPVLLRTIAVWPGQEPPTKEDLDLLKAIARDRKAIAKAAKGQ